MNQIEKLAEIKEKIISNDNSQISEQEINQYYQFLYEKKSHRNNDYLDLPKKQLLNSEQSLDTIKDLEIDFDSILRDSVEGFLLMDNDLNIYRTNPALCSMLSLPESRIVGNSLFDLVESTNYNELIVQKSLHQKGKKTSYKVNFLRPDNKVITCKINESPIKKNKKIIGSFAFVSDFDLINKMNKELEKRVRKRTSQLQRSLQTTKKIIEQMPIGVMVTNSKRTIISVNPAAKKMFEIEGNEIEGRRCNGLICNQDETCPLWDENTKFVNQEMIVAGRKGRIMPVLNTAIPMVINDENVILEAFVDISELKETQKAMQISEKKYRGIFEKFQDVFYRINLDGRILVVSPSVKDVFGFTVEEMIGKNFYELSSLSKRFKRIAALLNENKSLREREAIFVHKNGKKIICSLSARIVKDEYNRTTIEGVIRDISLRKKAEKDIKNAMRKAHEANLAKSEFLANMSHEIRTPMNAILGFSHLLESSNLDKTQTAYVDSINSAGRSLLKIINDILDLSKIEARRIELEINEVETKSFFEEFEKVFMLRIQSKGLKFVVNISRNIPPLLEIDEVRIRQIIFNLLGNAVKFTEKGTISLIIDIDKITDKTCELIIIVEDTGIGIPKNDQPKIFESFRQQDGQSNKKYGGTGLGLTISAKLVRLMNGTLSLESIVGKGSKFKISLPDIKYNSKYVKIEKEKSDIIFAESDVVLVDNSSSNRLLIKEIFKNSNLKFRDAENGLEAINLVEEKRPDIVLMDIFMCKANGNNLIKQIRGLSGNENLPFIALSALALNNEIEKIRETGFDDVVTKPIETEKLTKVLSQYLQHTKIDRAETSENDFNVELKDYLNKHSDKMKYLQVIEEDYLNEFRLAIDSMRMKSIQEFSTKFAKFIKKHKLTILYEINDDIKTSIASFDLENIEFQFNKLQTILAELY